LVADVLVCLISTWIAFALRLDIWFSFSDPQLKVFAIATAISLPIFIHYGLYRAIFRFTGWPALLAMGRALIIFCILMFCLITIYGVDNVPRSIGILQPIFFIFGIGLNRAVIRYILNDGVGVSSIIKDQKILIFGISLEAQELAVRLFNLPDKLVFGFVDEGIKLAGNTINGIPVFSMSHLKKLFEKDNINEIHLISEKISNQRYNEILLLLESYPYIRLIKHNAQDSYGKFVSDEALGNYKINDLLSRSQVVIDEVSIQSSICNKVILVTGSGGSIGSEICRQVLNHRPKTLLLIENSEHALYKIYEDLLELSIDNNVSTNIVPIIASVSNQLRMKELISSWKPDVIYHAAAYKHVPLVESNPAEAILNNVQGTLICATLAIEFGVARFILVSTDKAVRPTNVMGASKRLAEMLLQALAENLKHQQKSTLSMVRFGNVLGSSGSVVPLFARQIALGGPITITHPEVTRYFMSIPEASRLVIQASILGKGGEVFLLDMGSPVRIIDLAKKMILLSGKSLKDELNPKGDIEIQVTGLRPGEKLYEELLIGASPVNTEHPKIMRAMESFMPWSELEKRLNRLFSHCVQGNINDIKLILNELVDGYEPHPDIVDLTYLERS
jgi:FlaA1/EpsC-like NDP-sugar epimerase